METKHIITTRKAYPSRSMGPHVRQVIPSAVEHLDPFVFLDHFGPVEKKPNGQGVPPHPHAGIATITYLFSGSNRHQDSYGHDEMIYAGDLAWMRAGKGIVHAEGMNEGRTEAETVHGLQLWISLPAKDKFIDPDFFYYPKSTLPEFDHEGATIKVICGELFGYTSPVVSSSPAYIYEVKLPAGTEINLPISDGNTCGVYLVEGEAISGENTTLPTTMTRYTEEGESITVKAVADSHFMVLGGQPLNEPIVAYASFVMNSQQQIQQVIQDYQSGKMGQL